MGEEAGTDDNLEVVRESFDAYSRGDADGMLDIYAPDVEFLPGASFPESAPTLGSDAVRQWERARQDSNLRPLAPEAPKVGASEGPETRMNTGVPGLLRLTTHGRYSGVSGPNPGGCGRAATTLSLARRPLASAARGRSLHLDQRPGRAITNPHVRGPTWQRPLRHVRFARRRCAVARLTSSV